MVAPAASWDVIEVGGTGTWNFPTDSCEFPTEDIIGAED